MAGYLIAEEGPLSGQAIRFEEGKEWVLGRDPDESGIVLEDPMVSRRHVICRLTGEGYVLENLSSVNPATQNGRVITEAVLMREGDIIQIGNTFFRFTERNPSEKVDSPQPFERHDELSIEGGDDARWMLKVVSGPNSGAEFNMQKASTYILGKDPSLCDIVFQDLSVSRQHARVSIDEDDQAWIEDLGSRNGVIVGGMPIVDRHRLGSQDLVSLGTTSFLMIDREKPQETIISLPTAAAVAREEQREEAMSTSQAIPWKERVIPKKHLILTGGLLAFVLVVAMGMISLLKTEPIPIPQKHETEQIAHAIKQYTDIQFTFNESNGKLFLVGHVLTPVEHQELLYIIRAMPFVQNIEDNVVIDEYVWQNVNALLTSNGAWQGVSISSIEPGRFVMRGYLQTLDQAQALSDYMNLNFPYLDRLNNQVVVETNLQMQVESMLFEHGFTGVTFQLSNGELVLTGRVDSKHSSSFNSLLHQFKEIMGIRMVKNFVVLTSGADSARTDLSSKYQVTGFSKRDDKDYFVFINGKILGKNDILDGMKITGVLPNMVLLEKDGLKFRINYNLQ
jgi:type III secretion system YscD/HrpQ family protein